jgi:hypothetical protein
MFPMLHAWFAPTGLGAHNYGRLAEWVSLGTILDDTPKQEMSRVGR